jgi:hypothetical protein
MGRRSRTLVLAGALIAASVGLATTTAAASASAPLLSAGTLHSPGVAMSDLFGKLKIERVAVDACRTLRANLRFIARRVARSPIRPVSRSRSATSRATPRLPANGGRGRPHTPWTM